MEKNLFYIKLTGFFLFGFALCGVNYLGITLFNEFQQSEILGWLWLTGLPSFLYLGMIIIIGMDIVYLTAFAHWIIGRRKMLQQKDKTLE